MQSPQPTVAGNPSGFVKELTEFSEMGFDLSALTLPNFQELDDMKLFADEVMAAFS